jgi:hypothetical protein
VGRANIARSSTIETGVAYMKTVRRSLGALAVSACALAATAPVSDAQTAVLPFALPAFPAGAVLGGNQISSTPCVKTNRPAVGATNGSSSHDSCGLLLSFGAPQIGQIATVIGPTIIGGTVSTPITTSP